MIDTEKPPQPTGYRNPPVEHRFKKGESGNPKGRPVKPERALNPRQIRRDIINVAETLTRIRTPEGERTVTIIEAVLVRLAHKAVNGHGPSIRYLMTLYERAVKEHHDLHPDVFGFLDLIERGRVENIILPENEKHSANFVNQIRKRTRQNF